MIEGILMGSSFYGWDEARKEILTSNKPIEAIALSDTDTVPVIVAEYFMKKAQQRLEEYKNA